MFMDEMFQRTQNWIEERLLAVEDAREIAADRLHQNGYD
jgi:hypothetical protein